jgi:hypothetical protein
MAEEARGPERRFLRARRSQPLEGLGDPRQDGFQVMRH